MKVNDEVKPIVDSLAYSYGDINGDTDYESSSYSIRKFRRTNYLNIKVSGN